MQDNHPQGLIPLVDRDVMSQPLDHSSTRALAPSCFGFLSKAKNGFKKLVSCVDYVDARLQAFSCKIRTIRAKIPIPVVHAEKFFPQHFSKRHTTDTSQGSLTSIFSLGLVVITQLIIGWIFPILEPTQVLALIVLAPFIEELLRASDQNFSSSIHILEAQVYPGHIVLSAVPSFTLRYFLHVVNNYIAVYHPVGCIGFSWFIIVNVAYAYFFQKHSRKFTFLDGFFLFKCIATSGALLNHIVG